jgi:hypothetical protein
MIIVRNAGARCRSEDLKKNVAEILRERPDGLMPGREELDQIVAGKVTLAMKMNAIEQSYTWLDDFLPSLNLFRIVADFALTAIKPRDEHDRSSKFLGHRAALRELYEDAANVHTQGHQEFGISGDRGPVSDMAAVELLKCYRLYMRYVEALVLEVWPDFDRELLFDPYFGFMKQIA